MNEIVVELLTRLSEAQREDFEERAGIMLYDGRLNRNHAKCLAQENPYISEFKLSWLPTFCGGHSF